MKNGMIECSVCHSKLVSPSTKSVSRAYDRHRNKVSSKQRALNFLLVGGDCVLVGLQPILVFMSKVDGKFKFSPISVNFLTEAVKVIFAIVMLLIQARRQKVGEKPLQCAKWCNDVVVEDALKDWPVAVRGGEPSIPFRIYRYVLKNDASTRLWKTACARTF
ncbi:CMP-sialic acid transporter 4-like [Olea europaea var. sylvestris]|uniref:CMP-sialic acid transporter 4-like n=1 Tax=Olea europaea var. sylvestris TaxID=158386 RepID=UPI000C1D165D|nr:CMP-sialic acid transporter 4-like [Olea europaea var. sylvestris]